MHDQLGAWFDDHRYLLIERFRRAVTDTQRFPGFSALAPRQLKEVIRREVDGISSFMKSDEESLKQATTDHKDQSRRFLASIPIKEQLEFLQARVEILHEMFMGEPDTVDLRREFQRKLEMGKRFYRTQSRAIDLEQRFSNLDNDAS